MLMNKFLARGREFAKISLDAEDPHTNTTGLLSGEWLHSFGVGHEGLYDELEAFKLGRSP